jgi:hypothetical protein
MVIRNNAEVSREILRRLAVDDFPAEHARGHVDALQRLRRRSFGVVVTPPDSDIAEDRKIEHPAASVAPESVSVRKPQSFFAERPRPAIEIPPRVLRYHSRRDFLLFGPAL